MQLSSWGGISCSQASSGWVLSGYQLLVSDESVCLQSCAAYVSPDACKSERQMHAVTYTHVLIEAWLTATTFLLSALLPELHK